MPNHMKTGISEISDRDSTVKVSELDLTDSGNVSAQELGTFEVVNGVEVSYCARVTVKTTSK